MQGVSAYTKGKRRQTPRQELNVPFIGTEEARRDKEYMVLSRRSLEKSDSQAEVGSPGL